MHRMIGVGKTTALGNRMNHSIELISETKVYVLYFRLVFGVMAGLGQLYM